MKAKAFFTANMNCAEVLRRMRAFFCVEAK